MKIDFGFIIIVIFLAIALIATISFPFIHINGMYGLKHKAIMNSETLWHKTHIWASIFTVPFDVIYVLFLFIDSAITKAILGTLLIFLLIFVWDLVVYFCSKNEVQKKKNIEQKELEENTKKESGWM